MVSGGSWRTPPRRSSFTFRKSGPAQLGLTDSSEVGASPAVPAEKADRCEEGGQEVRRTEEFQEGKDGTSPDQSGCAIVPGCKQASQLSGAGMPSQVLA